MIISSGAVGYCETSALTQSGVKDAMMVAIRAGLDMHTRAGNRRRKFRLPWR